MWLQLGLSSITKVQTLNLLPSPSQYLDKKNPDQLTGVALRKSCLLSWLEANLGEELAHEDKTHATYDGAWID